MCLLSMFVCTLESIPVLNLHGNRRYFQNFQVLTRIRLQEKKNVQNSLNSLILL